ncbi:MAG: ATP-grasp domain-containing protein [Oligoflexia bacterium]|nr:ATP-grasp domain-containing protein [Oligoflexia bacterium]
MTKKTFSASVSEPEKKIALVTQCHWPPGFRIGKSLIEDGWKIISAGRFIPTMLQNYPGVIAEIEYPDPFAFPDNFIECILKTIAKYNINYIVPVTEESFVFSAYKDRFQSSGSTVLVPEMDKLLYLLDKKNIPEISKACGVDTPETMLIQTADDVLTAINTMPLPIFIKPRLGSGSSNILKIDKDSPALKKSDIDKVLIRPMLAQQYIKGMVVSYTIFVDRGKVHFVVGQKNSHQYPISSGVSCRRIFYDNDKIKEDCIKILAHANYKGVAVIDFILEEGSGNHYLIDINPRFGTNIGFAIDCNIPVTKLYMQEMIAAKAKIDSTDFSAQAISPINYFKNVENRWLLAEMGVAIQYLKQGKLFDIIKMIRKTNGEGGVICYDDFNFKNITSFINQFKAYRYSRKHYGTNNFSTIASEKFLESLMIPNSPIKN